MQSRKINCNLLRDQDLYHLSSLSPSLAPFLHPPHSALYFILPWSYHWCTMEPRFPPKRQGCVQRSSTASQDQTTCFSTKINTKHKCIWSCRLVLSVELNWGAENSCHSTISQDTLSKTRGEKFEQFVLLALKWEIYYPGQKKWDSRACQTTGTCMLERARADAPAACGCLNFFGQGGSFHFFDYFINFCWTLTAWVWGCLGIPVMNTYQAIPDIGHKIAGIVTSQFSEDVQQDRVQLQRWQQGWQ